MKKSFATAEKRVRYLGSAKEGVGHWWWQRVSAMALIPLSIWFIASLVLLSGADYSLWRAWVQSPYVAVGMALFMLGAIYHGVLGLQVVIEDYLPHHGSRLFWILLVNFAGWILGALSLVVFIQLFVGR
ncbi:MAG TPA: succinate dehydrogenase, hydrophobic membrane anchor protein [Dongiaceae bacterium]|jgi:succinate dehydrogenase / fumarate reductase membrane anchor subunit|nr:succinate dehydrogenase, hydrophobic membrane anchor protein [Dongiaceae bacterium]